MVRFARPLAAVVVGVGLVACGDNGRTPPSPIPPLAAGRSANDMALYPQPGRVEYKVRGTLPNLVTHAVAYKLAATTNTDRVGKLARAFDVRAAVTVDAFGWTATSGELTLRVQRFGGLPWTVSNISGDGTVSSGCAVAEPANKTSTEPPPTCPTTTTVPGLPSKAEAERVARSALTRAGIDVAGASALASGSPTQWNVAFSNSIAGVPLTGGSCAVAVGANAAIEYASGYLAEPSAAGDYPLAGVPEGLERLKKGAPWIIYGGPGPVPMMGAASDAGAARKDASPPVATGATPSSCAPDEPCSSPGAPPAEPPTPAPCGDGTPCPTVTEPPPFVVIITGVHLGLGWGSPADPAIPDAWLVPVYVFEIDGGSTISVLAVTDSFLTTTTSASRAPTEKADL